MNLTRLYTFVGIVFVLLSFLLLLKGMFWETIFILGSIVVAGLCLIFWNLRR